MNHYSWLSTLFIIMSMLAADCFAQDSLGDTLLIEEVVVKGIPVRSIHNSMPMAISVINAEQIGASSESSLLPVLSGRVPGLFITERGITGFGVATGSAGQITMRGVGGSPTTGVLVLIDGHPQYMGIFGHPLPDAYVASDVERVEIIRGPASILYGSNAMGGVINILTKSQKEEGLKGNGRIIAGAYNTQKYMLAGGYKKDKWSVYASFNRDVTDGHREHSAFDIYNGYVKLGYELNKNFTITSDLSLASFRAEDPGPDTINASHGKSIDVDRGYWSFSFDNQFKKVSGSLKLFHNFGTHKITDGFRSSDFNYGINFFESFKLTKNTSLTVGFDYNVFGGRAENILAMNGKGVVFADAALNELGIYGFIQQKVNKGLMVNTGLRYVQHKIYGSTWVPSVGFVYQLSNDITWKGSFSKGFRSPTMRELFMWQHNEGLQPESINNYEIGLVYKGSNNKYLLELTYFFLKGDNLITNVPNSGYQNSGKIKNQGVEFSAKANLSKSAKIQLAYSYINMKNIVYATPEHQLFAGVEYGKGKFGFNADIQHITNIDTDLGQSTFFESFTLLITKISFKLITNVVLHAKGENLLNQDYAINRYYSMPGATFQGGINFKF